MICAIIILAIIAIYQHFRISYVRDQSIELIERSIYVDRICKIMDNAKDGKIDLKRWCIEQALKKSSHDPVGSAKEIENYILSIDEEKEFKEKMRNK